MKNKIIWTPEKEEWVKLIIEEYVKEWIDPPTGADVLDDEYHAVRVVATIIEKVQPIQVEGNDRKIINPEAEKWRAVANKFYNSWVNLTDDTLREAIKEYKQLIEEENEKEN